MTLEKRRELEELGEWCKGLPGDIYIFWKYGETAPFESPWAVMRYRSMPCTPAGDQICEITEEMSLEEAKEVIKNGALEFKRKDDIRGLASEILSEERRLTASQERIARLKAEMENIRGQRSRRRLRR